jgi:pilus assembly protein CpaB
MNRRVLAVLAAVILAATGTGAVLLYLRSADARALQGKETRAVLVADKQIPAGTEAATLEKEGYVRQVRMPAETLPEDALDSVGTDLEALVTTGPVQRGQLLLRAMLGTAVMKGAGLVVPEGKMAVTARVTSAVFGPGDLQAGTKVAIFYTYTPAAEGRRNVVSGAGLERGRDTNNVTRLLMTDVEVLSVGLAPSEDGELSSQKNAEGQLAVTFGLDQKQAERLAHAVALGGQLNIGLLGDASNVKPDDGVDNGTLFG